MRALSIGVGATYLANLCREISRVSEEEGPRAALRLVGESGREHERVQRVLAKLVQAATASAIAAAP